MSSRVSQPRQDEWEYQWSRLWDADSWLFEEWIHPGKLSDFMGKTVLEAGCGPGHHTRLMAEHARRVVGLDLNAAAIAREKTKDLANVEIISADIAQWDSGERFDVVLSVGVVHHTQSPDETVAHLKTLLKPGGRLILWVYSREGNGLNRWLLEPVKTFLISRMKRSHVMALAHALTAGLYPIVHTLYRLPLTSLPYHEYFGNFRLLSYTRNFSNVFDKLNAPTTHFISKPQSERWLTGLSQTHLSPYLGASWRVSGTR